MKCIVFILFFFSIESNGQESFNLRLNFDSPSVVLTNILPTDSCYYGLGVIANSVIPFTSGNLFVKFDLDGNVLNSKTLHNEGRTIETWKNTVDELPNGNFIASGNSSISDGTKSVFLIEYNTNGDTVAFREYFHPWLPNYPHIHNVDFKKHPNNGHVYCTLARVNFDNPNDVDYYVFKTDALGNVEWDYFFGNNKWDVPMSMVVEETTGNIIVGGIKTNQNFVTSNYDFQTYIIGLDSLGNELWSYLSPNTEGLRDGAKDMILLEDGSLIVASGFGYEQERASVNVVWYEKSIFKLNTNQEVEWEREFKGPHISGLTYTENLIKLSDGSGVLVSGSHVRPNPTPDIWGSYGWLGKVSLGGDSIWTRKFFYLENDKFVRRAKSPFKYC